MKIRLSKDEVVDTETLSLETLAQLCDRIADQATEINNQFDLARRRSGLTGEYSDPDWFNRLSVARRKMNLARERLRNELAQRKKLARMAQSAEENVYKFFMAVAKERLSDMVFDQLMAEAVRRHNDSQAGWKISAHFLFEKD